MASAGINCDKYKAHSVRSAASSKANRCNVPIDSILQVAGWSKLMPRHLPNFTVKMWKVLIVLALLVRQCLRNKLHPFDHILISVSEINDSA